MAKHVADKVAQHEKNEEKAAAELAQHNRECEAIFESLDVDQQGTIGLDEFLLLKDLEGVSLSEAELRAIFAEKDADRSGSLDLDEFKTIKHVLMVDLDMGSLLSREGARPARPLYRVMSERGVCVVNEYSEDAVHERLGSVLRNVRALREYFAEVHVLRTTAHNVMYVATVERVPRKLDAPAGATSFQRLCAAADAIRFVGGLELDLGRRLRQVPENRYTRYS